MSAIAGRGLAAIAEAEHEAPPEEGLSTLELETVTRVVFGTEETPLPRPASQHLRGMLRGTGVGTFDAHGVPRPYTKEKFLEIYSHQCDSTKKLTVAQEEELARREVEELRQRSLAESCGTFARTGWEEEESASNEGGWGSAGGWGTSDTGGWGTSDTGGWGAATGGNAGGWGAATGGNTGRWDAAFGGETSKWRASCEDQRGEEEEIEAEPPVVHLGHPPRPAAPALPPPDVQPRSDSWDTIDWGNEPSLRDALEFLALMLTMANDEEEAEEAAVEPAQAPDEDPAEAHAHYMRTSGFRADDALWHQRLGHPSRVMLKNCIKAGVFAPGALLHPDGTEVRGATLPRNCTVCPGATSRMRYIWVVNVEARSRAYEVFHLWLAHAQRQSEEKLKIWQSDGAAEFRSKELQDYLAQKGIEHHISLPYTHLQ
ncbi:unnamed protein product [Closterium sp. NIES-54]